MNLQMEETLMCEGARSFHGSTRLSPHLWLPTWKVSKPHTVGILMEASSHSYKRWLTPFLGPLSSLEVRECPGQPK